MIQQEIEEYTRNRNIVASLKESAKLQYVACSNGRGTCSSESRMHSEGGWK